MGGTIALILGFIGMFLPILPTTPFLLLAAWCYAHSSHSLYKWLTHHQLLGPYIRDYLEKRGVLLRIKVLALVLLWSGITWAVVSVVQILHARIALVMIALGVTIHILKLRTLRTKRRD